MLGVPVGVNGSFTINDASGGVPDYSPFYYIKLEAVDGLRTADLSYESHPLPNQNTEISGDVYRLGGTITLTGVIWALNIAALEAGAEYLQSAFASTDRFQMIWTPIGDPTQIYVTVRVNQDLSIVRSFQDGKYRWPWTIGLRADDPKTHATSDDSVYPTWQV